MENPLGYSMEDEQMELPPGFRFHPTDEELITHYLSPKVLDSNFNAVAIGEADFNKIEPWDLPRKAKIGEKEWYFFCVRDRKYPTGLRTNRATEAGYWKATGKDKEIYKAKTLVGMKKTLVFYTGRAPKGQKTNWVMHEYRLEGKYSKVNHPKHIKNEWVISRVFNKNLDAKEPNVAGFASPEELQPAFLPPLMDYSPYSSETKAITTASSSHMTCFSSHMVAEDQHKPTRSQENDLVSSSALFSMKSSLPNLLKDQDMVDVKFMESIFAHDQSMWKLLLEGKGSNESSNSKAGLLQETSSSGGNNLSTYTASGISNHEMIHNPPRPNDLDCLWNY